MHLLQCVPHIAVSVRKGGLDPVLQEQLYTVIVWKHKRGENRDTTAKPNN
jgi:hypothetical protein